MDEKVLNLNLLKKSRCQNIAGKEKKSPWKADYRALITMLKGQYEKYMYHCRIIY